LTAKPAAIASVSADHYTLANDDLDGRIRVEVTATNTGGSATALSSATAAVTGTPSNITAPVISGTTQSGETLATSNGTWTGAPTVFTYSWQSCDVTGGNCTTASASTAASYPLTATDLVSS
jgi:hypothetical protein